MGYGVHIKRSNGETIGVDEWEGAVAATKGVRLTAHAPWVLENPATGAQISRPYNRGDADIFDSDSQSWMRAITFHGDSISIRAARDFEDPNSPQRHVMRDLADCLDALIVGDDGEVFD